GQQPYWGAVWVPGHWNWNFGWVWMRGHWSQPPVDDYLWCEPYYENRGGLVVFVAGHWQPRGAVFTPPPMGVYVQPAPYRGRRGVYVGAPPPRYGGGVFVPPPRGWRPGTVVPAPPRPRVVQPPPPRPGLPPPPPRRPQPPRP